MLGEGAEDVDDDDGRSELVEEEEDDEETLLETFPTICKIASTCSLSGENIGTHNTGSDPAVISRGS